MARRKNPSKGGKKSKAPKLRKRGSAHAALFPRDITPAGEEKAWALSPQQAIRFEFGKRFRKAMAEAGVRQIDVANATGIGRDSISGYTRGRVLSVGDRLNALCEFLHVSPEQLVPAYGVDTRVADIMPAMSFEGTKDGMGWLRINQVVTFEEASRIMEILRVRMAAQSASSETSLPATISRPV